MHAIRFSAIQVVAGRLQSRLVSLWLYLVWQITYAGRTPLSAFATLRILETTDLHVHLLPYDYHTDQPNAGVGLSRTASLIRKLRAEERNCLLFDNGDYLQGTPLSDFVAKVSGIHESSPHPAIAAMNTLDYDAANLGNHEFNFGLDFLLDALAHANFPVTCANIARNLGEEPTQDDTLVRQYLMLDRMIRDDQGASHPIRIGVIGFAPPQILQWDSHHLHGQITTRDIVETARALLPQLKQDGADIVIALCHSGIGAEVRSPMMENAAVPLAAVDGIDVVLAGHTHLVFPSDQFAKTDVVDPSRGHLHGKPAVMAGFNGSHLGVIDLCLRRDDGQWRIIGDHVRAIPIARRNLASNTIEGLVPCDVFVRDAATSAHDATIAHVRQPVGQTSVPLQSYFSQISNDAILQIVADAQRTAVQSFLTGGPLADRLILSAVAPFMVGARGGPDHFIDIPAGPLAHRNVAELYVYPNTLSLLELTGAQLHLWLERSAGAFARITIGNDNQPLLDPNFPCYNFDVIDGLTYVIDPSEPSRFDAQGVEICADARRVRDIRIDGEPIIEDQSFLVVTNSYRAGGGGSFQGAIAGHALATGKVSATDALIDHLRKTGDLAGHCTRTWRFAHLPDTTAQFESGPQARNYLRGQHSRPRSQLCWPRR